MKLVSALPLGFQNAAGVLVGINYGKFKFEKAKGLIWKIILMNFLIVMLIACLGSLYSANLLRLFGSDADIIKVAKQSLTLSLFGFLPDST